MIITNKSIIDFGVLSYNDTKQDSLIVTNTGVVSTVVSITTSSPSFSVSSSSITLIPNESVMLYVSFMPTTIDTFVETLFLVSSEGNVNVQLNGISISAGIYVDKISLNFGNIALHSSGQQTVLVSNISPVDVNLILSSVTTSNPVFSEAITEYKLTKERALQILTTFTPLDISLQTGQLTISCNDETQPIITINLTGSGIASPIILTSTNLIDFGSVSVGQVLSKNFQIFNEGVVDLNVTGISSNNAVFSASPAGGIVAPGEFLSINISYQPIINGIITACLSITSNDPVTQIKNVDLQGTAVIPSIRVSPSVLDFGNSAVDQHKTLSMTIQNLTSLTTLVIYDIQITDSVFSINEIFPILVTSSKTIDVTFLPTVIGGKEGLLRIVSNDLEHPLVEIFAQGVGVNPDISVQPTSLEFGNTAVATPSNLSVSITNLGLGKLVISSITSTSSLFIVDQTNLEVEPKSSGNLQVTFIPDTTGLKTGHVHLINNDPDSPDISILLSGFGAYPSIEYTPVAQDFGSTVIGDSKTGNVTVRNTGRANLELSISSNSTIFQALQDSLTVNPNTSSYFTVLFRPEALQQYLGTITLNTNDPDKPVILIQETGTGINSPKITISPTTLQFSEVPVGGSQILSAIVSNSGTQILSFTASVRNPLRPGRPPSFSVQPESGHVDIQGYTSLDITFAPHDLETLTGTLRVLSNDVLNPLVEVSLQGTVIPAVLSWDKINTESWIPKEIYTIATSLTTIIDPLVSGLEFVTEVLNIIKMFIIDIQDPMKILLDQIKKTIDDFINDLSSTGLYAIYIMPGQLGVNPFAYPQYFRNMPKEKYNIFDVSHPSWFDCVKGGYSSFVSKLVGSFDDPGDGNRPQFSDNAMVGGYVMMFDSGTIGPDDIATFIRSIQKLMKLFKSPFKVAFEPPSNTSCFAGNKQVRVTFTPSTSTLPKEYFIFRSETQGGDFVTYKDDTGVYPCHDENGNPLRSYELIGITNVLKQIGTILGVDEDNAKTLLGELGYAVKELSKTALNGDPLRFAYEDKQVENGKSYYYVVAAGYTNTVSNYQSIISKKILTTDFDKKIVSTVDPKTLKPVETEINPRTMSETGIVAMGLLSNEASAMPLSVSLEVKGGLARCRNFRCGFEKDAIEFHRITSITAPEFIIIGNTPIAGTVKIKITRNGNEFTANPSSYRVDYKPKSNPENPDVKSYESTTSMIYIKSRYYFKSEDSLKITYKYKKDLKTEYFEEPVILGGTDLSDQTFLTSKKPIDSSSAEIYEGTSLVPSKDVMVLNDKDGRIKVNRRPGTKLKATYNFYPDFENEDYFKCVRPEYSRYFFDIAKCDAGETLCPGYDNANCYYNNGRECTNPDKSQRRQLTISGGIKDFQPEDIAFKDFWDPISCQNGMMQQRCDGYSKTFPRYSPKVWPDWSSIRLSALGLFPKIEEIMKIMQNLMDSLLAGTEKMSTAITSFIDLLQKKIDSLKNLLLTIKSFLTVITEDFALPDLYFLRIPYGRGGNEYLKTSISNATNGPESDSTAYTAGAMFAYGTPGLGDALKLFFG